MALSVLTQNIHHNTKQYKQCNGLRSLKKYIQGGMPIYRSCEFYHNNSAKKWRVQEVQGQIFDGMSMKGEINQYDFGSNCTVVIISLSV